MRPSSVLIELRTINSILDDIDEIDDYAERRRQALLVRSRLLDVHESVNTYIEEVTFNPQWDMQEFVPSSVKLWFGETVERCIDIINNQNTQEMLERLPDFH